MGLTNKKEDQLKKMPNIESKVFKSQDGRFLVHKTIITDIKPVSYYEVVMANEQNEEVKIEQEVEKIEQEV